MCGKLYGVGTGSGDKELITLKALRILKESDVIAAPKMKSGEMTAYNIVKDYIKDKEIMECYMPMNKNFSELQKSYEKIADMIEERLKNGETVAFITLGDPTIYSTYMQINSIIKGRGYETEIISGVASFCAAAARLNIPLCERDEPLVILPASYEELENVIKLRGNKVLMKSGKAASDIKRILKKEGFAGKIYIVERCGMENEKIYKNIDDLKEKSDYFSIFIIRD